MEDLNNRQMVLLTLLTSFVVSVGTGIVTVAMLEEAPPVLTQTVNRVVERTIERVVAGTSTPEKVQPVTSVTKEVTIYAKEDDLIVAAVEKNQPRIALIYPSTDATGTPPLATGFVISRDGVVVADLKSIALEGGLLRESYQVGVGEKMYTAIPMKHDAITKTPLVLLQLDTKQEGAIFDAITFGRQADPKIAQTVIALGGADGTGVFKGSLAKFHFAKAESTTTPHRMVAIDMAPKIPEDNVGALVVNLDAQAVGIVVHHEDGIQLVVYPASRILDLITAVSSDGSNSASTNDSKKAENAS